MNDAVTRNVQCKAIREMFIEGLMLTVEAEADIYCRAARKHLVLIQLNYSYICRKNRYGKRELFLEF
jgi:hypothetical protein